MCELKKARSPSVLNKESIRNGALAGSDADADWANSWLLDAASSGTVSSLSGRFGGMKNFTDGTGADTLTVVDGGSLTGVFSGGVNAAWTLNGSGNSTLDLGGDGTDLRFAVVANLTGGSGDES